MFYGGIKRRDSRLSMIGILVDWDSTMRTSVVYIYEGMHLVHTFSQQGVRVSFWHPGPRKIPILGGKDTLSFEQNFLKILITSRYSKKFYS